MTKDFLVRFLLILLIFIPLFTLSAENKKLPRFATVKSNEVNARVGPGRNYPIEWVFIKKFEPVEIIEEYEQWRKVRDINNEGGWVHVSVLSGKRGVIITGKEITNLIKTSDPDSKLIAKLSMGLRCMLNKCVQNYCRIKCENYQGWVRKENLWGVYPDENP